MKFKSHYMICLLSAVMHLSFLSFCYGANLFPHYGVLKPNVEFWKKIYAEYEYNQSIIHDKSNPLIVYKVLDFNDDPSTSTLRERRKREKAACRKYHNMLLKLASVYKPATIEEKRIFAMFGKTCSRAKLRRAAGNIRCQRGQKDRFLEGVARSGAYISDMRRIFSMYGLPEELCYLPHVESSFQPYARSKCGAAGMWQFMKGTGRRFLRIDYLVDERLDPAASTRAAAELLHENYQRLGSWPLAITAYNHGAAGVERALSQMGSFEKIIREHRGRRFRFASRNFYAECLAAKEVAEHYAENAGEVKWDVQEKTVMIRMPGYVSFQELATLLNLAPSELERLNPALRKPVLRGERYIPTGYKIRLPLLDSSAFSLLMAAGVRPVFMNAQRKGGIYRVRRGDTATMVAIRHGVSLRKLASINDLDSRYTIYAGQRLRLPSF